MNEHKDPLIIIEKYDKFVKYIYPLAVNISRKHHVLRDEFLKTIFAQYGLFADAAKSNQISKLYAADAGLAHIRVLLRFLSHQDWKQISKRQYEVSGLMLAEAGSILGKMIVNKKVGN